MAGGRRIIGDQSNAADGPDHRRRIRLDELELPSRRVRSRQLEPTASLARPLGSRAFIGRSPGSGRLAILDSVNAPAWRPLPLGDSLRQAVALPSPDGTAYGLFASVWDTNSIYIGTVDGAQPQLVHRFVKPGWIVALWNRQGIHVARWLRDDERPSLWRIDGDRLTRVTTLTEPCALDQGMALAPNAPMAACIVVENRSDVWIFDGVGE